MILILILILSGLTLLAGIYNQDVYKARISGLLDNLRRHIIMFISTSLGDTIQRILLGEPVLCLEVESM